MDSASESTEQAADGVTPPPVNGLAVGSRTGPRRGTRRFPERDRARNARLPRSLTHTQMAILAYVGSRVLLLAVAAVDSAVHHHWSLLREFNNWDGGWYRALAVQGYEHHVPHGVSVSSQKTTGFFPLYPMLVWLFSRPLLLAGHSHVLAVWTAPIIAGVVIAGVGGLIATLIVQRLAAGWWGEDAGLRAAALFCFFPGSVVFSMVYAEGIMIPLAAGCILALQRRRWLLAGLLAAFATGSEPEAAVLIVVCAVSAARELHRRGWRHPAALRSLAAPGLAPAGLIGVLAFMWAWTGSPFSYWTTQHDGWMEKFNPFALVHLAVRLSQQISFAHFNHPTINLNWPVGLAGAVLLVILLVLKLRIRRTISLEAWVWTLGIGFVAVTSQWVPPNPRLLITAFPAVTVLAYYFRRRAYGWLLLANGALLAGMSAITFVAVTLRP